MNMDDKTAMRIAAEAGCDPRTVLSVYEGRPSRKLTRGRIVAAAAKLKLPAPPKEKKAS
jgi:DNA-binding LacI/PurR family transcriptional regulator